jgi:D-sedoheptulose 7-phosphate isomerase
MHMLMRRHRRKPEEKVQSKFNHNIMSIIKQEFLEAKKVLEDFLSDDTNFERLVLAGSMMVASLKNGHKLISCGNGGSMCDAMHFAEELSGLYRNRRKALAAISISDPAHITCTGNDIGFDHVFSRYVEAMGQENDVLLAISTSGNSANVIQAAVTARSKGMKVVGLTGKDGGKLAGLCDVEIRAPFSPYSDRTQEIHIKIIHVLIHYIEKNT